MAREVNLYTSNWQASRKSRYHECNSLMDETNLPTLKREGRFLVIKVPNS